jgi:hypothetical protein
LIEAEEYSCEKRREPLRGDREAKYLVHGGHLPTWEVVGKRDAGADAGHGAWDGLRDEV